MLRERGLQPAPLPEPDAPDLPPPTPPTPALSVPSAPSRRATGTSSHLTTTSTPSSAEGPGSARTTAEDGPACAGEDALEPAGSGAAVRDDDAQAPPGTPEEEDLPDWWDDVPGQEPTPEFQLVRLPAAFRIVCMHDHMNVHLCRIH